jgi:aryl sulfotransferase
MKNIIWLASYPKSGNTWFRIFLSNLLDDKEDPTDINNISSTHGIASARNIFDEITGIEASDLSHDEVDVLRPGLYNTISDEAQRTLFIKVHDAYTFLPDKSPLFPPSATKGIIYIIRNPLDVAVSNSNHNSCTVQQSIDLMGVENNGLCAKNKRLKDQLRQKIGTWSDHVTSWTNAPEQKIHIIRYEDMKLSPLKTFTAAVEFAGLDFDRKAVEAAIEKSSFEEMQKQEKEKGFKERPIGAPSFFRKGEAGSWREHLTAEQAKQIIQDHSRVMQAHGYLTTEGKIVF